MKAVLIVIILYSGGSGDHSTASMVEMPTLAGCLSEAARLKQESRIDGPGLSGARLKLICVEKK